MFKRIGLFLMVNFLVIMVVSLVLNVLGVRPYITAYGIDYSSLMIFCLVWGMGGAFVSLALSRKMAKWMMGVKIVDPQTDHPQMQQLVQRVHNLSRSANLPKLPQVGVYQSPEVNAFATGPTKSRSLVAVSTGLLERMSDDQIEGVLGHEVAHIANGDMVTMTLLQGVVNAFVMFLARAIAFAIMQLGSSRDNDSSEGMSYFAYIITVFVLEMIFMIFGSMVVAWFSRLREFKADAGGAKLTGRDKMITALKGLQSTVEVQDPRLNKPALNAFKISTKRKGSFVRYFSSHPPLEDRIARLETMTSI